MITREDHSPPNRQQPPLQPPQLRLELPTAARELLAGFAAGAANVTSGYPFDTVKVRLQSAARGQYDGAVHCCRSIIRHEGIRRGLFRGLSSPLVGGTAETGVNYLVYSRVLDALRPDAGGGSGGGGGSAPGGGAAAVPLPSVAVAGAVAGAALSFILGPTELIKCRMQQAGSSVRYPGGPLQCLRDIVAREGGLVGGLSRGLGATMAREVPGNALFFVAYEALRRGVLGARQTAVTNAPAAGFSPAAVEPWPLPSSPSSSSPSSSSSALAPGFDSTAVQADVRHGAAHSAALSGEAVGSSGRLPQHHQHHQQQQQRADDSHTRRHWLTEAAIAVFCGGTAGTVMWAAVLPIDVAKTRLQTARPGSEWDVGLRKHWLMLWREGGLASLYAGLTPTLVRAFPANACQWLAWELVMRNLGGEGDH
ncbi:hypothetical protein PLESTB_000334100 [Pleodorina starrii]|uniref:Uncharacterized protein n=1 Tax=Pleodorina starrii TaxID=330485 RepID=A0A9W6EYI1_9CHLO|nr:hypothetical protein PLESTM_001882900 [Pleodorina starrii]GLC50023.1 hypothetical protein PLESTB_000334100 [Pleodorina starrii]